MALDHSLEIIRISAEDTRALRWAVLRPGRPFEETVFAGDDCAPTLHMGVLLDSTIVGVASLTPEPCPIDPQDGDWQLRGMATAAAVQGRGIGSALLAECVRRVGEQGARRVWCNGRTSALRFYARLGFRPVGEEFHRPRTGPHFILVRQL